MTFDFAIFSDAWLTILSNPILIVWVFVGVTSGVMMGCLPGLTATTGCALLIPFTFGRPPLEGLLMLMGVFVGGIYGGSISGILIRTPGTPSAAATLLDGYPLAQKGLGGKAIGMSTVASFVGGTVGALIMTFLSPTIASVGLKFGPAEFFALALFGMSMIIAVSGVSILKGVISALIGLLITTIGFDPLSGLPRFTMGEMYLLDGLPFIPVLIGLFGIAQVFRNVEKMGVGERIKTDLTRILPEFREIWATKVTMLKSAVMGTFIGSIPGTGCDIAAFASYTEAKRSSKHPEKFGTGVLEGVAAPEAGNNAATGGAMIPMLTLGVPGDAFTAVMLGALTIHNFEPGPIFFRENLDIVYPMFAGMILAQVVLLFVGLIGARFFARLISLDPKYFTAVIFLLCIVGSYAMQFNSTDVFIALGVGLLAYFMEYYRFPVSPILLALILGPLAEQNLRRALQIARGDFTTFINPMEHPIALAFIIIAITALTSMYFRLRKSRLEELARERMSAE
jgi:putative tricarboxylic transport membrane protein